MIPPEELRQEIRMETKKLKNMHIVNKIMDFIYLMIFVLSVGLTFTSCEKEIEYDDSIFECTFVYYGGAIEYERFRGKVPMDSAIKKRTPWLIKHRCWEVF